MFWTDAGVCSGPAFIYSGFQLFPLLGRNSRNSDFGRQKSSTPVPRIVGIVISDTLNLRKFLKKNRRLRRRVLDPYHAIRGIVGLGLFVEIWMWSGIVVLVATRCSTDVPNFLRNSRNSDFQNIFCSQDIQDPG